MDQQKSNEAIKEFLLADHAHFSTMFANSEQSGETRVNWFIGILTATTGGLLALIVKQREAQDTLLDPALLFAIVFVGVCGLLVFGIITLMRMMMRNTSTDRQKRSLDEVRQMFQDHLDPQHMLLCYHPLGHYQKDDEAEADSKNNKSAQDSQQQQSPEQAEPSAPSHEDDEEEDDDSVWSEFKRERKKQRKKGRLRKLGGLAHTVAAINSALVAVLLALIVYAVLRVEGRPALPAPNWRPLVAWGVGITVVSFIAFYLQWLWITYSEIKARRDIHKGDCTHAGGVVFKREGGKVEYLLVRPKKHDPSKNEWVLPKGKIEQYESHQETARREVCEETGVETRLVSLIDQVEFKVKKKLVRSKFYLMKKIDWKKTDCKKSDDREITWAQFAEAHQSLTHPESKNILELADGRLNVVDKVENRS